MQDIDMEKILTSNEVARTSFPIADGECPSCRARFKGKNKANGFDVVRVTAPEFLSPFKEFYGDRIFHAYECHFCKAVWSEAELQPAVVTDIRIESVGEERQKINIVVGEKTICVAIDLPNTPEKVARVFRFIADLVEASK